MNVAKNGLKARNEKMKCKIRELRKAKGYKQWQVAWKSEISQQGLSKIELGITMPNWDTAYKIACAIGCKIDDLYEVD